MALVGLVFMQVYWVRNAISLKQDEFERGANDAILAVVDRLEQAEALKQLRTHQQGRYLFFDEDAENKITSAGVDTAYDLMVIKQYSRQGDQVEISIKEEENGNSSTHSIQRNVGDTIDGSEDFPLDFYFENRGSDPYLSTGEPVQIEDSLIRERMKIKRAFVGDIVKSLIEVNLFEPIEERIEQEKLEEIIESELKRFGIKASYEYGVFDEKERCRICNTSDSIQWTENTELQAKLFPNDVVKDPYFLRLYFPSQNAYLLQTNWLMLATSILIILSIMTIFGYTVRTIVTQKKNSVIKNDFINNMTHEFKTPISTISLACEALNDGDMRAIPQAVDRYIGMINDENKRLGMLVEEVLQSAVLDKGDFKLKLEKLDIHDVLHRVSDRMELKIKEKNGRIKLNLNAISTNINADRIHLANVFNNLIDNANKYSRETPSIEISTYNREDHLVIEVKDEGIGISPENQKRVFDKLYRVPTGNIHDVKGFGLGLSYVKIITEKLGGSVELKSQIGKGSTFIINLPRYGKL